MLASPESVLAPGHGLPMKGSIMNPFLLPLPGPPARRGCGPLRARPQPGRGSGAPAAPPPPPPPRAQGRHWRDRAARRRSRRRRPSRPPRPFLLCVPARAQAGPRAPRPPLPSSGRPPRRRRRRPHRSRPFWTRRLAFAINTQEMHDLTREVEPFPLCGHRPAAGGGFWSAEEGRGGRRRAGRGGRSASQRQALFTAPHQSPSRQGEERKSSCPRGLREDRAHLAVTLGWPQTEPPSHLCLRF